MTLLKTAALSAAMLTGLAGAASADQITLTKPMQGATLHDVLVDMSVYWVPEGDAQKVVATYAPRTEPTDSARLVMLMQDGDSVAFSLPGHAGVVYGFSQVDGAVTVTSAATAQQLALN